MAQKRRFVEKLPYGSQLFGNNFLEYPLHKFRVFENIDHHTPLYPFSCGDDYWHRECFRQRINSNVFAVEYVSEGIFIFNHNGIEVRCAPGEIFLVHMGSDSSMRCETLTAVKKVVNITGSLLQALLSATGLDRVYHIRPADNSRIDRIFEEIYSVGSRQPFDQFTMSKLCYELLLTLAEQAVVSPRPEELQKAIVFISESLDRQVTLTEIAQAACVSKATLNRLFQQYMQCSPINYFLKQKLEKARFLLQYYPAKKISSMLNYSSCQYFSAEFKKHYGISPRNFRHRLEEMPFNAIRENPEITSD